MSTANPAPQHIGRYEIVGELGKGAMGLVYKARDPNIGRLVALKTMRLDVHGMEANEMLMRFKNEARAAGVLNHSNIVTIYDAGEYEALFYIAMEYIEGVTLQKVLNEHGVLPVEQVLEYSKQICSGLDYAHSQKIVHRDVKPANIMIEPDGRVKIMDFGIAKGEGAGLTSAGQVLGTPNYMSPEQVKGRPLDGRSDLWSFGVILYEMVTGERPFTGQNVTTIIYKIVNENPIPPKELDCSIHPGLSAVIQRALAKNPNERYQKGADLVHHLVNHKSLGGETAALPVNAAAAPAIKSAGPAAPTASAPAQPAPHAAAVAAPKPAPVPQAVKAAPIASGSGKPISRPAQDEMSNETLVAGSTPDIPAQRKPNRAAAVQEVVSKLTPNQWLMVAVAVLLVAIAVLAISIRQQKAPPPVSHSVAVQPSGTPVGSEPATTPGAPIPTPVETAAASEQPTIATPKPAAKVRLKTSSSGPSVPSAPAAASTVTASTNGTLHLVTNPPGAKVDIDGWSDPNWITPFDSPNLSGGKHKIVFSKQGFSPQTQIVDVWPGKQVIIATSLNAAVTPSRLEITSDPAGALITLDGKETGRQTPANLEVTPGDHKVILHKLGYKDALLAANVKAGETAKLSQPLKAGTGGSNPLGKIFGGGAPEGMGNLQVKTKPKGATVKVNGQEAPKTTPFKLPVDPGTYNVAVSMEGYKAVTQSVTIEKGKTATVELELQK